MKNLICKACGKPLVQIDDSSAMLLGCNSTYCNMAGVNVTGNLNDFGKVEIFGQSQNLDLTDNDINFNKELWFSRAEAILSDYWDCKVENVTFDLFS